MNLPQAGESKTAFIICGALAREVRAILERHQWRVDLFGIPAIAHMYPERIGPAVEKKYLAICANYDRVLVIYGECGTKGSLDHILGAHDLERVNGPHCYEMYGGQIFTKLMEEEPGTFFLTDFLVRGFHGTVWRGLGLDRFPELREEYFRNYRRLVYLAQTDDPGLQAKAQEISIKLELPLEIIHSGYSPFEKRLVAFMEQNRTGNSESHSTCDKDREGRL